jgi:hypothetical protein
MAKQEQTKKMTRKYTVTLAPLENLPYSAPPRICVVVPPYYNRETDECIFQKAWHTVNEKRAQGLYKTGTTLPKGGIRLRGAHAKQHA